MIDNGRGDPKNLFFPLFPIAVRCNFRLGGVKKVDEGLDVLLWSIDQRPQGWIGPAMLIDKPKSSGAVIIHLALDILHLCVIIS